MYRQRSLNPETAPPQKSAAKAAKHVSVRRQESKRASDIPVILIESSAFLREMLAKVLESTRFHVMAACSSFGTLPSSLEYPPELIVVGDGDITVVTRVLEECSERYPAARRVVLSEHHGEQFMAMLKAGAHGCLGRDVTVDTLLLSFELAMLGTSFICQSGAPIAPSQSAENRQNAHFTGAPISGGPAPDGFSHELSKREIVIIECLVHGESNKVIARKFQIAEATVKVHIKSILRKIRAVNRTQAAIWAMTHLSSRCTEAIRTDPPKAA